MANNYSNIGLDAQLNSIRSLRNRGGVFVDNIQYDSRILAQADRINVSKINVENLILLSAVATATGSFSSSQSLSLSTTLTYVTPNTNERIFGIVYLGLYEGSGTAAADQIFPTLGANVTPGRYEVMGAYDVQGWDNIASVWKGNIIDTNGTSSQQVTFQTQWWHIDNRTSSAA